MVGWGMCGRREKKAVGPRLLLPAGKHARAVPQLTVRGREAIMSMSTD